MPSRPSTHPYQGTSKSRSRAAKVLNDLGLAIVSGRFGQGGLLPGDAELTGGYNVSRTVVREALKALSAKGLVQSKARVGTSVRPRAAWNLFDSDVLIWHAQIGLSADFLTHLGEMRLALEPAGARLAAQRRTAVDLEELRDWIEMMAEPDISPRAFVGADLGLHLSVARAAGNPFLLSVSTLIEVALVAMLTVSSPAEEPERLQESVAQHRAIVDAIEASDPSAAEAAMRAVIQVGIDRSRPHV